MDFAIFGFSRIFPNVLEINRGNRGKTGMDGMWLVLGGYIELSSGDHTQTHQFSTDHPMKAWWNYWDALSESKCKSFEKQLQNRGLGSGFCPDG